MWFWKGHLEKEKMVVVMIWQELAALREGSEWIYVYSQTVCDCLQTV